MKSPTQWGCSNPSWWPILDLTESSQDTQKYQEINNKSEVNPTPTILIYVSVGSNRKQNDLQKNGKSKYFERTPTDPTSLQSGWDNIWGFGGHLGRVSERALLTLVRLSSLARGIVKFLEDHQPRRVPSQAGCDPHGYHQRWLPAGEPQFGFTCVCICME